MFSSIAGIKFLQPCTKKENPEKRGIHIQAFLVTAVEAHSDYPALTLNILEADKEHKTYKDNSDWPKPRGNGTLRSGGLLAQVC